MSIDGDPGTPCPKCGFFSQNPEMCDACGALLSRIRGRDFLQQTPEEDEDFDSGPSVDQPAYDDNPFDYSPQRPWFTYAAIVLTLIAAGVGYYVIKNRQGGELSSPATVAESSAGDRPRVMVAPAVNPAPVTRSTPAPRAVTPAPTREVPPQVLVPHHTPTGGKVAEDAKPILSWLDSLKNSSTPSQQTPDSTAVATTPTPHATPASTARIAARATPRPPGEIDIGEEMFNSAVTDPAARAASVLEALENQAAPSNQPPTATPEAPPVRVTVPQANDDTFLSEVGMYAEMPVLVGFWNPNDPSAVAIHRNLAGMQESFGGQLKVVAVDVTTAKSTASRFGATGGPTMILFKRGREQARAANPLSQSDVHVFVASQLAGQ